MIVRKSLLQAGRRAGIRLGQVFSARMGFAPLAISQAWSDSIGLLFSFAVLMPAIATVCIVVSIISGRGEKAEDGKLSGRWGRKRS
jgi:hypothetical protein